MLCISWLWYCDSLSSMAVSSPRIKNRLSPTILANDSSSSSRSPPTKSFPKIITNVWRFRVLIRSPSPQVCFLVGTRKSYLSHAREKTEKKTFLYCKVMNKPVQGWITYNFKILCEEKKTCFVLDVKKTVPSMQTSFSWITFLFFLKPNRMPEKFRYVVKARLSIEWTIF